MNVAVWSKPQCPYCDMAKRLLEQKGIYYTAVTLGEEFTREESWWRNSPQQELFQ